MQADRPVVLLAYVHSSKKKRGVQELRTLQTLLSDKASPDAISWQREGHDAIWGVDCFSGRTVSSPIQGIHLSLHLDHTEHWWLNDYAGRKAQLDWDQIRLDEISGLRWVWIDGQHSTEASEKMLFSGSPVVLTGDESLATAWYKYLAEGYSISEAWHLAGDNLPVYVIPSDPFEYWAWREKRVNAESGPALLVLSSNESALEYCPVPDGVPLFAEVEVERVKEKQPRETICSWDVHNLARSIEVARREELEYRHPSEKGKEVGTALAVTDGFEPEWDIPEERIIEITSREDVRFRPRKRVLATVMSACLCIGLLLVGVWQMGWKLSEDQIDRLAHFSTFSDSARFRVILLPFHPEQGCSPTNIWDEMAVRDHLISRPEATELGLEVTYITPGSCPDREEDARRLAEIYNADVLIWGETSGEKSNDLQLHYVLAEGASDLELRRLMGVHRLANGHLGGSTETVVDQVLAIGFFANAMPREALSYLDQNVSVPTPVAAWRELAIVLSLEDMHQPEEALTRCEEALDTFGNRADFAFHSQRLRDIVYPATSIDAAMKGKAVPAAQVEQELAKR